MTTDDAEHASANASSKSIQPQIASSDASNTKRQSPKDKSAVDPFVRERVFPDPFEIFAFCPKALEEIKDSAIVMLDANTLLFPYNVDKLAFDAVSKVYTYLAKEKRLVVSEQATREFGIHRLPKIARLYSEANQWRQGLPTMQKRVSPSLELLAEYAKYAEAHTKAVNAVTACRDSLDAIIGRLEGWYHEDPVLALYRGLFDKNSLVSADETKAELIEDNTWRNLHKLPPGSSNDDAKKDDEGIGDKLIWHSLLKAGAQRKCHAIYVTQDITKNDCVHYNKEQKKVLFPRYELTDEYRRASEGHTLYIIELSDLLQLYDAEQSAVQSIRAAEETVEEAVEEPFSGKGAVYTRYLKNLSPLEQVKLNLLQQLCVRMPLEEAMREVSRRLSGETPASAAFSEAKLQQMLRNEAARNIPLL